MVKNDDFTKYITDMLAAYKMDNSAMTGAFKNSAELADKMSQVALEAAERANDVSAQWAKDTLSKMGDVTTSKSDPADYTKAMSEFAAAQAEMSAEMMSAYAEIAKKVQMETVELMMGATKDMQEEIASAVSTPKPAAKKKAAPRRKTK
ncbi:phasin, PhaP [Dinoroseobacter sp. S124A]|uniref:phasin, PhaP n=1 Tax=Dinoroseobacter sp. S124A TaxID=3415128 RepID=UPI003C79DFCE